MKARIVFLSTVFLTLLALGCADVMGPLIAARDQTVAVKSEAGNVVSDLEAQVAKLPPNDPARPGLEKAVAKAKEVMAQADKALNLANETITSLQNGQVSPALSAALSAIPYGSYVGIGLSLLLAFQQRQKGAAANAALASVVRSWEEVGPPLNDGDKAEVAAIQGPVVTAKVHAIKAKLKKAPPVKVA